MTIKEIKDAVEAAKSNLTKAEAVFEEVENHIEKNIKDLKELGVPIPDNSGKSKSEYFSECVNAAEEYVEKLREEVTKVKEELEEILNGFNSEDSSDVPF